MLQFNHTIATARPLLAAFISSLLLLLSALPGYAQSEPTATSDPANEVFNAAIVAPSHESPAPNTVSTGLTDPPVGVPTLSWASVPDATRYNVQISVSEGFATTLVNQNTTATAYTPKELFADGTYFWRVRAEVDKAWGNFSEPWSFRKDWSADGVLKPLLLAPADDPGGQQPITNFSPEQFSWEPVLGAAAYTLEISVSPSFNDPQIYRQTTLKPHHTPTRQFANNQYYWRVIPLDTRDRAGAPSEVRTFTFAWNQIPTLLTPEDDINSRFLPRFTWTAVPGASEYILDISTQENFSSVDASVRTPNTSYTPEKALSNNKDYFWRVRAVSPQNVNGPVSETRRFRAHWVQPPSLLSPPTHSIYHIYPYFSWTPVAGAERYQIQIATGTGFDNMIEDITLYNATAYTQPEWKTLEFEKDIFWRVRAIDAQGNTTNWSNVQSFQFATNPPPNLIYPEPYYSPDAEGMPIHTDRTIAYPLFVWDNSHERLGSNGPSAYIYPDYYLLEVANDLPFKEIVFTIESAGQAAAPTQTDPFNNLIDGNRYYWRVSPMRDGTRMNIAGTWGTVWETRIDRNVPQLPLDNDTVPDLLHPAEGFIAVGAAPVLGWLPISNAHHYEVQISTRRDFASLADSANALFPYYVPWQGRQEPMPAGAYWWRVQAQDAAGNSLGDWSSTRHFMIANELMTGNTNDYAVPENGTLLDSGPLYEPALSLVATSTITAPIPFDLGALHVIQDRAITGNLNWVVAFGASSGVVGSATYALYIDVNQQEQVGGTTDPRGKPIITDPLYRPEYVIYLDRTDDAITSGLFYEWTGSTWQAPLHLNNIGGSFRYDSVSQSVQVLLRYASIVKEDTDQFSGALALTVYSTASESLAGPQDSVPTQGGILETPALVSNMPMPLYPFDTPLSNPTVFRELPTLRWRMPHFNSTDGYQIEVARNADFTRDTIVETWESYESGIGSLYGPIPSAFHSGKAYNDDESYYWRVRYRHERYGTAGQYDVGPWSPPMRFKLTSYQVGNPMVTLGNPATGEAAPVTPSFTWQRVEGAGGYTIQVDNDFNMGSPITNKKIDANSYTALDTLADGTYYWRVAMRRSDNVLGQWTPVMSFTKTSLVPTLVGPVNDQIVNAQPTFVWSATMSNTGELRIATPKYRLQWASNPQFNSPTTVETESTSYTPLKGQSLSDGTWYWRVAVIDADGRRGPDSAPARFYKEYLRPEPLAPVQGASQGETISFEWSPLAGAAYYNLEIANNEAFDKSIKVSTDNTRYTHTSAFVPGDYHWRVQMVDKDKILGPTIAGRFSQAASQVFIPIVLAP